MRTTLVDVRLTCAKATWSRRLSQKARETPRTDPVRDNLLLARDRCLSFVVILPGGWPRERQFGDRWASLVRPEVRAEVLGIGPGEFCTEQHEQTDVVNPDQ